MDKPLIAISDDFFSAFAALPKQTQSKVMDFMDKFRTNPQSPGINYEKIHDAFDPNIRSVRIDDTYRGIVIRQAKTGVYLLLWVDHHDKAYQWASRKRCKVNSTTGTVQLFDVSETVVEIEREVIKEPPLFDSVTDVQLLKLGVPEEKLEETRTIISLQDFYNLKDTFPEEAYEGLEWVANGFSPEEVLKMLYQSEVATTQVVDTEDFETALNKPGSLRSFTIVDGEAELQAMMSAPLDKWRVFLHPTQRKVVNRDFNGPARVTGGAGTGKTVVAMHRARRLARELPGGERVLFTTYTANLASDIQENLRKICTIEELRKIEVINLDAWVWNFLRGLNLEYGPIYGNDVSKLWEDAIILSGEDLDFSTEFYQDEWSQVVCTQGITTLREYVQASRIGRGVRLERKTRFSIWKVFEEFRSLLIERRVRDIETAMTECKQFINHNHIEPLYSSIIVDEGQDLSPSAYRLLRAMAGEEHANDLFIVGDSHQRIYRHKASLSACGVNIRGRSSYLRVNYRTTEEIRRWAFGLLKGLSFDDLDDGLDDGTSCVSLIHGAEPMARDFQTADQEFDYILEQIQTIIEQDGTPEGICIVGRTNKIVREFAERLRGNGIDFYEIRRSKVDDRRHKGVRVATMHRVKGLEFEHVLVISANRQTIPLAHVLNVEDEQTRKSMLKRERCLLYVALTRAKRSVTVTSYGGMSDFVGPLVGE